MNNFDIKWEIKNFNFLPLKRGEMLRSPPFNIAISEPLFLELYPRGDILDSDSETIILCLNHNLKMYTVTECDLSAVIVVDNEQEKVTFKRWKCIGLKWAFKEWDSPKLHILDRFGEMTLTVKCIFSQNKYEPNCCDMETLSQDIENLFTSQNFSDLTLIIAKEKFPVHECIITSRIPKLLEDLKPSEKNESSNTKEVMGMDPETLKFLLFYVYTGKLPTLKSDMYNPSGIPNGLYKAVEKYQLDDLKHKLYFTPRELSAHTNIRVEDITFEWTVKDVDLTVNRKICSPAIPGGTIFNSDFKLICQCLNENDESKVMQITVQRIASDNPIPIYVKLKINIYGEKFQQQFLNHIFIANEKWSLPLSMDFPSKNLDLHCFLYISSGQKSSIVKSESCKTKFGNAKNDSEHLSHFCSDLGQLYNIFLPKMSDISLHIGHVLFPVHKAILAARSAVFSKMFETDMLEKKSGIVKITDIEVGKVDMMLIYIYSGKLEIANANTAMEMYAVADKYEITSLKKKCASYINSAIGNDNVCEIYIFADMYSDENLKTLARRYLCSNAKQILRTSIFQSLINIRPDLASEVLHELLNIGRLIY